MAARSEVLSLYRGILKAAKQFPSIKRNQIIEDIKVEFRAKKDLADCAQVEEAKRVAVRSLEQMEAYTGMNRAAPDWQVSLKGACE